MIGPTGFKATIWTITTITVFLILLRALIRYSILRRAFTEDYFLYISAIFTLTVCIFNNDIGNNVYHVDDHHYATGTLWPDDMLSGSSSDETTKSLRVVVNNEFSVLYLYLIAVYSGKASVILFLRRQMKEITNRNKFEVVRSAWWVTLITTFIALCVSLVAVPFSWTNHGFPPSRRGFLACTAIWLTCAVDVLSTVFLALLQVPYLPQLYPGIKQRRLFITSILFISSGVIFSMLRARALYKSLKNMDELIPLAIWTQAACCVATLVASSPGFRNVCIFTENLKNNILSELGSEEHQKATTNGVSNGHVDAENEKQEFAEPAGEEGVDGQRRVVVDPEHI